METTLFRRCLGIPFYKKLLEDVIRYDNIPDYNHLLTYAEDDLVLLDGTVFRSLVNSNTEHPVIVSNWEIAPKFTNAYYQELWDNFLRYYLGYMLIYTTITYSTFQAGEKGVMQTKNYQEVGQSTVDLKTLNVWKKNCKNDAIDYLENMKEYIRENILYFPELKTFCGIVCSTKKSRRIGFRRTNGYL